MLLLITFGGGFILYLYYLLDRQGFNNNMYNLYFTGLNTYHYYAIRVEEIFEYYNNLVIQDQRQQQSTSSNVSSTDINIHLNTETTNEEQSNENEIVYSYQPYKTEHTLSYYNYIPNVNMIDTSKNPILFLKSYVNNEYKYLQFNDISLNLNKYLPINPCKKTLFIQIELIYNGETYDISLNSIAPHLVNKNYIFNKKFTKWFMRQQFDVEIENNYTIKIIDDSINMVEIDDSQYIYVEDDTYHIQ